MIPVRGVRSNGSYWPELRLGPTAASASARLRRKLVLHRPGGPETSRSPSTRRRPVPASSRMTAGAALHPDPPRRRRGAHDLVLLFSRRRRHALTSARFPAPRA